MASDTDRDAVRLGRQLVTSYLVGSEESVDRVLTFLDGLSFAQARRAVLDGVVNAGRRTYPFRLFLLAVQLLKKPNQRWRPVLEKAVTKRGRVPELLRRPVREALSGLRWPSPGQAARLPDSQRTQSKLVAPREPVTGEITLTVSSTDISNYHTLLNHLDHLIEEGTSEVHINCSEAPHVYVFGLAILAAFMSANAITLSLHGGSSSTVDYMRRIGFLECLDGKDPDPFHDQSRNWAVKLTPIHSHTEVERVAGRLVEVFDFHLSLCQEDKDALYLVLAEVAENVLRHGEITSPGFMCAQVYPQRKKLSVAIVDAGIGIRNSFMRGDNDYAKQRILKGDEPIDLAVEKLQTSKQSSHAGYGLFVVRELILDNRGTLRLTSEGTSISYYRKGRHYRFKRATVRHRPWNGTVVAMIFDLNRQLCLEEVWERLPPPRGHEEDFFDQ